ncbi:MAG: hypothetical protein ABUK01_17290 [Leptospirales bacterium]
MYKILVIDDNHSFIDSFKVMLKDFPLQIESTYKFQNARTMLGQAGNYKNVLELQELLSYQTSLDGHKKEVEVLQKGKNSSEDGMVELPKEPERPEVYRPPFNTEGYLFVIAEYDTESGIKGTQFIQEVIRSDSSWQYEDFILLTTKLDSIESTVKALNVATFEKPIKQNNFKNLIADKIQQMHKLEELIEKITETNKIKILDKKRVRKPSVKNNTKKATKTSLLAKSKKSAKKK